MATETQIAFEGTKEQQELAARAFEVIKRKFPLHGVNAPMKTTLAAIAEAMIKAGGPLVSASASASAGAKPAELTSKLRAALRKNGAVFAEGDNGEFTTTKAGHAPNVGKLENTHTFKDRLNMEAKPLAPEEAKEYQSSLVNRTTTRADRSVVHETVIEMPPPAAPARQPYIPPISTPYTRSTDIPTLIPLSRVERERAQEEAEAQAAAAALTAPAAQPTQAVPTAPAAVTTPLAVAAPTTPATRTTPKPPTEEGPTTRRPVEPAPVATGPQPKSQSTPAAEAAVVPAAPATPAVPTEAQASTQTPAPVQAAPARPAQQAPAKPAAPAAPPAPVIMGPVEVIIPSENGPVLVDLREPVDEIMANVEAAAALEAIIASVVEADSRLIRFGSDVFSEEATERFSKGDYRRIKEYLDEPETGGVASDRDIVADVLGRRLDHPDYERLRFSLNYRMLKEKKDFEFVGIDSDRLWINAGTSPVTPSVRKPAEIGQDYRFLEDPATTWAEEEEDIARDYNGGPLEYSLTYYEYENGVLPYDRRFKRIFPGAVFDDQRSSLLRFEIPQLYGSLLAELRYPTGNRGGFIMGLAELFTDHLVPGAKFTITPTDRGEDVFEIHFTHAEEKEDNLLQLDERKGRYVFRPVAYTVATDPAMLLTQDKFGKLHNQKKLEEAERRRPDVIIANAFEAVGENNDGKLWAIFDDIYPIVNIERPISRSWLRTMLSGAYPFFYPDETTEGAYFYDVSKKPS